jgi:hypothetical protein
MTTYNTGNALGSKDVKDLYDNAENFDQAVNSPDATWVDRLGVTRVTLQGVTGDAATLTQLASGTGSSLIGFTPEGTGATPTTVQAALRDADESIQDLQEEIGTFAGAIDGKANDNEVVKLTGAQTIAGVKTFSSSPVVPNATTSTQALAFGQVSTANAAPVKTALNASGGAPIYACRAWVNFNGTGTVSIRASGNVSSITDNGTGDYTVNFTTAMPDANYAACVTSGPRGSNSEAATVFSYSSSSVRVQTHGGNGTLSYVLNVNTAIFR